jgi:hypothetical protein
MNNAWTPCRPREIARVAEKIRVRQRNQKLRGAMIPVVAVIVLVAVWTVPRRDRGPDFAGISCQHVAELSIAYREDRLAADLHDQVRRHLELCSNCRALFATAHQVSSRRQAVVPHRDLAWLRPARAGRPRR